MTEEEADALDERFTKNTYEPGPNGTGFFAKRLGFANTAQVVAADRASASAKPEKLSKYGEWIRAHPEGIGVTYVDMRAVMK